jgi:uncharacterized protein YbbK (DUF523 family)
MKEMISMLLVSACLAGINCRYSGNSCEDPAIAELVRQGKAIAICPEMMGGLGTPRPSCEIINVPDKGHRVISRDGRDFTAEFNKGAKKTLAVAKAIDCSKAILKSRSPSCGFGLIYDGSFTGKLVSGNGIAADLLVSHGIKVYTENDFHQDLAMFVNKD